MSPSVAGSGMGSGLVPHLARFGAPCAAAASGWG